MRVLSLFDGISCGRLALERAGIQVSYYAASEIDPIAIAISKNNWTDITHIGDVSNFYPKKGDFDLILAGSPCQGFSKAGKGNAFEDERSKLYFEFLRIKTAVEPKYFLLENVRMHEDHMERITSDLGVSPVKINSRLFSAQNRPRIYWTNINFDEPRDKGITLESIIGPYKGIHVYPRGFNPGGVQDYRGKAPCMTASDWSNNFKIVRMDDSIVKFTMDQMEQLQTLPCGYTSGVPKMKRIRALGNGWTVDVIAHILRGIKDGDVDLFNRI